jgi:hypothetical protein
MLVSYDLGFWWEPDLISSEDAARKYVHLERAGVVAGHPSVRAFYDAVLKEFGDLTEETKETSPWSAPIYGTDQCVVVTASWSQAADVGPRLVDLARQHGLTVFNPQTGEVELTGPSVNVPTGSNLELANGEVIRDPTRDHITIALRELGEADWYVILELQPDNFIQAGIGSEAGVPDGAYAVEFRAGRRDSHMGAVTRDLADVVTAFLGFLSGETGWQSRFRWSPVVY